MTTEYDEVNEDYWKLEFMRTMEGMIAMKCQKQ